MKISIVIPAFNENLDLNRLLKYILENSSEDLISEIIVSDFAHSSVVNIDGIIVLQSPEKGRAAQMIYATKYLTGQIYYFLHADSFPPPEFDKLILNAISNQKRAGCFKLKFDCNSGFLNFFSWFTRFNVDFFRGGDQSLFIAKELYDEIEGYNLDMKIMEDVEIIKRIKKKSKFGVLKQSIITSSRKYKENGVYKLQFHFAVLLLKYKLGYSQMNMLTYYSKHIR